MPDGQNDLLECLQRLCRKVYQRLYFRRRNSEREFKIKRFMANREWRAANPQRARDRQNTWRRLNPEKCKEYQARDWEKHGERRRANNRARWPRIAAQQHIKAAEWRLANPVRVLENHRAWYKLNKFKVILSNHRRRALQDGNLATPSDIHKILVSQEFKCKYCKQRIRRSEFHVDHVVPLIRGGSNGLDNLCIACIRCNLSKGSRLVGEWRSS